MDEEDEVVVGNVFLGTWNIVGECISLLPDQRFMVMNGTKRSTRRVLIQQLQSLKERSNVLSNCSIPLVYMCENLAFVHLVFIRRPIQRETPQK